MDSSWRVRFDGKVLLLGCGSVSRCLQPLLLRHVDMDHRDLTVMDFVDQRDRIPETLAAGAEYLTHRLTRDNFAATLSAYLSSGDLLVNLTWDVDTGALLRWCHDHGVHYLDTSIETWASSGDSTTSPAERTTYYRHQRLAELLGELDPAGPTAVVEHGANPGLVSHLTKRALEDVTTAILDRDAGIATTRADRLNTALRRGDHAVLAQETGTRGIHVSERDTQRTDRPKHVGEFVNTWSVKGFHEEGTAAAELSWGTHERGLPPRAVTHESGPRNQIYLDQTGMSTWVRSWVPSTGQFLGMLISHGETYTISEHLTVHDGDRAVYRPTVHFAYLPSDPALASVHECRMHSYELQDQHRILNEDITDGMDELGVLLLGHDLNGWWTGSQLDIHESRALLPGQNATTVQVAASALGALRWILRHPNRGVCVPDDLDHREVLDAASPYLGKQPSQATEWQPDNRDLFVSTGTSSNTGKSERSESDPWQFINILAD